jgi:ABC-type glycerol-3-phosphate transport system substrate-binding protein
MTDTKSASRFLLAVALVSGTALLAGCGRSDRESRTTTTEQSTTSVPVAPVTSTTTTTNTQQTRP